MIPDLCFLINVCEAVLSTGRIATGESVGYGGHEVIMRLVTFITKTAPQTKCIAGILADEMNGWA